MKIWIKLNKAVHWLLILLALTFLFIFDDILYFFLFESLLDIRLGAGMRILALSVLFVLNGLFAFAVYKTIRKPPTTGHEGMIGLKGLTLTPVSKQGGWIQVHGERWQACSDEAIPAGRKIQVLQMRPGLILKVAAGEKL